MSEPVVYRFPVKTSFQPPGRDAPVHPPAENTASKDERITRQDESTFHPLDEDCHTEIIGPESTAEKPPDRGKIVDICSYRRADQRYRDAIEEVRSVLAETSECLHETAINLAVNGPWREWEEQQPVGSQFFFDDQMLLESGDANVAVLVRLSVLLGQALDLIEAPAEFMRRFLVLQSAVCGSVRTLSLTGLPLSKSSPSAWMKSRRFKLPFC